jgi:hypothetical protein
LEELPPTRGLNSSFRWLVVLARLAPPTCNCVNLILPCIVCSQARKISRVLSQCDPVTNGVDTPLLKHVSPIEWDNVVLYGQYILDRKLVFIGRCHPRHIKEM